MSQSMLTNALVLLARSDGIAVTLSPLSKVIIGGVFLVVLGLVIRMVTYRKPDGAAYGADDAKQEADPGRNGTI